MTAAEEIFNSMILEIIIPEDVLHIPAGSEADDWLCSAANIKQRDKAFFDERLLLLFIVKIPHPGSDPAEPSAVPLELAHFLSHLQVTLDAKYIAPQQNHRSSTPKGRGINLAPPPRSHSYRNSAHASPDNHPSIFPPHTPNPTPQTDDADRRYAASNSRTEGTVLESYVWGESSRDELNEKTFTLLWSSIENTWVAVYRLNVAVSFMRTSAAEPLLTLTVSATLRQKPLAVTPERKPIAALLATAQKGDQVDTESAASSTTLSTINGSADANKSVEELDGLEEINLLEGLAQGPTFGGAGAISLNLPSVRLGPSLRRSAFSLPPIQPVSPKVSSPSAATPAAANTRGMAPVLRKSFLRTLQTVSGFHIRMKSVFVPYVVIPGTSEDEEERREAGSEERTVVLSVELGNGSALGGVGAIGFSVEKVDVSVGGEGAKASLIGWGENGLQKGDVVFPLLIGPAEQFNLLYAVTFLRQSGADDIADTLRSEANGEKITSPLGEVDMQRPVAIVIHGRPFELLQNTDITNVENLSYPTQTFRSRWNCILDLATASQAETFEVSSDPPSNRDALPAPASPFPAASPKTPRAFIDKTVLTSSPTDMYTVAGSKRHTISGLAERRLRLASSTRHRASTPNLGSNLGPISLASMPQSAVSGRFTPVPPSVALSPPPQSVNAYSAMPSLPPTSPTPRTPGLEPPLPTPAYPAYPSEPIPPTPAAQSPISSLHLAGAGPIIEPRRERIAPVGAPQTPGPRVLGGSTTHQMVTHDAEDDADPVVVSIGLVPPDNSRTSGADFIYVLDTFGIEIFVFNRSERTRWFEVSHPDRKRRRQQAAVAEDTYPDTIKAIEQSQSPGILPLENRIRVGPLRAHTCQSVRMQFLALRPGVHSIQTLTLLDVKTGYSKNLKAVMDIVVHEADET